MHFNLKTFLSLIFLNCKYLEIVLKLYLFFITFLPFISHTSSLFHIRKWLSESTLTPGALVVNVSKLLYIPSDYLYLSIFHHAIIFVKHISCLMKCMRGVQPDSTIHGSLVYWFLSNQVLRGLIKVFTMILK